MPDRPWKEVQPEYLAASISFAVKGVLRPILGRKRHEDIDADANKVTEAILAHLRLSGWRVWCRPLRGHSTPGPRREE